MSRGSSHAEPPPRASPAMQVAGWLGMSMEEAMEEAGPSDSQETAAGRPQL